MTFERSFARRAVNNVFQDFDFPLIDNLPLHWDLISQADLDDYVTLRKNFYDEIRKSKKGERHDAFIRRLRTIHDFVQRGDKDDWKRGLVCGILFLSKGIAIHIQQFRLLLGKCKSSINGSLQQIGFIAHPQGGPVEQELYSMVPIFQREKSEIKKWTVRDNTLNVILFSDDHKILNNPPELVNNVGTEAIEPVMRHFNVPIKFRLKYYHILHTSVATQTDE
ncbi:hypothetical protein TVAG_139290 [Trichomonas vaginalis G3]|uniref:Initiator binding domain-containing protein n=1 Tax=Trichomonas vaginalis (strain ATCC PRA-98 / G3) TaxID=412133 RepID=A2E4A3_TRIV3|nr:transcription-initiator DNA-binding domain ibd family [Trichomonas vaginalis G3]EAY12549.1 hypothetical protein TVAG_139290 [Trichomonas vaginalis G3]KAI5554091.1 transcription-initiator DNA-binding domain ibd family [Trichomonas vaginalis G3]|eukprot:XP_001324772.1 hypothetical protein [Trichomonas vaginalis G3]